MNHVLIMHKIKSHEQLSSNLDYLFLTQWLLLDIFSLFKKILQLTIPHYFLHNIIIMLIMEQFKDWNNVGVRNRFEYLQLIFH